MDHEEWDWHWKKAISRLHFQGGMSHFRARQLGQEITERRFGPRPKKPKKLGRIKAALLRVAGRSFMPEGVKTFVRRWLPLLSVLYLGLIAGFKWFAERGCDFCEMGARAVQTVGGVLALAPDPELALAIAGFVTAAGATYGASYKVVKITRAEMAKRKAK